MKNTKKKVVCLGGLKTTNMKSIRRLNLSGAASISYFKSS